MKEIVMGKSVVSKISGRKFREFLGSYAPKSKVGFPGDQLRNPISKYYKEENDNVVSANLAKNLRSLELKVVVDGKLKTHREPLPNWAQDLAAELSQHEHNSISAQRALGIFDQVYGSLR
jgi:hypothetical protein